MYLRRAVQLRVVRATKEGGTTISLLLYIDRAHVLVGCISQDNVVLYVS